MAARESDPHAALRGMSLTITPRLAVLAMIGWKIVWVSVISIPTFVRPAARKH
jgi:hypothetical protein